MWLTLEIKHHYANLQTWEMQTYELHLRLTKDLIMPSKRMIWTDFEIWMHEEIRKEKLKRRMVLTKKYKALRGENSTECIGTTNEEEKPDTYIEGFVQNFSSVQLDGDELELLNKGLRFCLTRTKPPVEEFVADVMWSTENLIEEEKDEETRDEINEEALRALRNLKRDFIPEKSAIHYVNVAESLRTLFAITMCTKLEYFLISSKSNCVMVKI